MDNARTVGRGIITAKKEVREKNLAPKGPQRGSQEKDLGLRFKGEEERCRCQFPWPRTRNARAPAEHSREPHPARGRDVGASTPARRPKLGKWASGRASVQGQTPPPPPSQALAQSLAPRSASVTAPPWCSAGKHSETPGLEQQATARPGCPHRTKAVQHQ